MQVLHRWPDYMDEIPVNAIDYGHCVYVDNKIIIHAPVCDELRNKWNGGERNLITLASSIKPTDPHWQRWLVGGNLDKHIVKWILVNRYKIDVTAEQRRALSDQMGCTAFNESMGVKEKK